METLLDEQWWVKFNEWLDRLAPLWFDKNDKERKYYEYCKPSRGMEDHDIAIEMAKKGHMPQLPVLFESVEQWQSYYDAYWKAVMPWDTLIKDYYDASQKYRWCEGEMYHNLPHGIWLASDKWAIRKYNGITIIPISDLPSVLENKE